MKEISGTFPCSFKVIRLVDLASTHSVAVELTFSQLLLTRRDFGNSAQRKEM